jgi:hypothetical protein
MTEFFNDGGGEVGTTAVTMTLLSSIGTQFTGN